MKSKTSFFNGTVLRLDVTRFAPVWILYTVGFLLFLLMQLGSQTTDYEKACLMQQMLIYVIPINGIYAFVVSQTLFGDLLVPRMCNAVHAMPLTRDDFFTTHTFAGFCFSVIPNALVVLLALPMLGKAIPTAMYLFVMLVGSYVFYFGTALLSIQLAGNRIAGMIIYGILNFVTVPLIWFARMLYEPLMYGVEIPIRATVWKLCPTLALMNPKYIYPYGEEIFDGLNYDHTELRAIIRVDGWETLGIWVLVGFAAMAAAQILYRRRKLETAGDLLAHKRTEPFFLVIFTMAMGCGFHIAANILNLNSGAGGILFLLVGITVGWFAGRMLLMQQVKVFRWKTLVPLGAILVVTVLSICAAVFDFFGVVHKIPEMDRIVSVRVAPHDYGRKMGVIVTEPDQIAELRDVHRGALREFDNRGKRNLLTGGDGIIKAWNRQGLRYTNMTLTYTLDDGSEVERSYYIAGKTAEGDIVKKYMNTPDSVFDLENATVDRVLEKTEAAEINMFFLRYRGMDVANNPDYRGLLEAVMADCEENKMCRVYAFRNDEEETFEIASLYIQYDEADPNYADELYYKYHTEHKPMLMTDMYIRSDCTNTLNWMIKEGIMTQGELDSLFEAAARERG